MRGRHLSRFQENCPGEVDVDIAVKSNEFFDGSMARIASFGQTGGLAEAVPLISPNR